MLKIASKCGFKLARAWVDQEGRMILGFANAPEIEPEIEKREGNVWDNALAHEDR